MKSKEKKIIKMDDFKSIFIEVFDRIKEEEWEKMVSEYFKNRLK